MEAINLILKEDLYIDGFYILPKGTKKVITGIRYNDNNEYQIYIPDLYSYHWLEESKCDFTL